VKALHIFPTFGPELFNGAERHEYLLSKKLAELGVAISVFTTQTKNARQTSALSSDWPSEYTERAEIVDAMQVRRFPVSFSLSPRIGYVLSRAMLKRWNREEECGGLMVKGSRNLVEYYHRRAIERPLAYDLMMMLARGPYSIGLLARLISAAREHDVLLVGFTPFRAELAGHSSRQCVAQAGGAPSPVPSR